jgi:hypothetical protein
VHKRGSDRLATDVPGLPRPVSVVVSSSNPFPTTYLHVQFLRHVVQYCSQGATFGGPESSRAHALETAPQRSSSFFLFFSETPLSCSLHVLLFGKSVAPQHKLETDMLFKRVQMHEICIGYLLLQLLVC